MNNNARYTIRAMRLPVVRVFGNDTSKCVRRRKVLRVVYRGRGIVMANPFYGI